MLSDKLFFWLFQNNPDRILSLVEGLPADAAGYTFSAPALKEREYRLDGLFLPPADRPDLPALILEAQMAADAGFLRRLLRRISAPSAAGAQHQCLASSGDRPVASAPFRGSGAGG